MNFAACRRQQMIVRDYDKVKECIKTYLNLGVRDVSMGDSCIAHSPKIAESDILAPDSYSVEVCMILC